MAKKINADWNRLQNDPDNWIDIPEFNVYPVDVGFKGFSRPVVGPADKDTTFHAAVRELISEVRGYASKRFKSLAELRRVDEDAQKKFESEFNLEGGIVHIPVGDEIFVYRYECIFAFLDAAVDSNSKSKSECLEYLSFAAIEVARIMTNAAVDPQQLIGNVRREFGKSGGHAKSKKSPKTSEKDQVEMLWREWQAQPLRPNGEKNTNTNLLLLKTCCKNFFISRVSLWLNAGAASGKRNSLRLQSSYSASKVRTVLVGCY